MRKFWNSWTTTMGRLLAAPERIDIHAVTLKALVATVERMEKEIEELRDRGERDVLALHRARQERNESFEALVRLQNAIASGLAFNSLGQVIDVSGNDPKT